MTRETEVMADGPPDRMPWLPMGALIGIGAGFGLVLGALLGNITLGLAGGAGVGTVAGAIMETRRPRT